MTDIQLSGYPELGTKEGDFGGSYAGYRWQTTVTEAPFGKDVREVRVAVLWSAGPRVERLELLRFMRNPQARP
jgi:hypothetical protein